MPVKRVLFKRVLCWECKEVFLANDQHPTIIGTENVGSHYCCGPCRGSDQYAAKRVRGKKTQLFKFRLLRRK